MAFLSWLAEFRNPVLDVIFSVITYGGQEAFLLAVIGICYWCVDKRFAYRLGFPYFIAGVTVNGIKLICRVERPWIKDPGFKAVESAKAGATGYSFPSGHTFSATVLATSFALRFRRVLWKVLCFVFMALVMFSRMYLGVHTPQDVLVSCAICLTVTIVANIVIDRVQVTDKNRLWIALGVAGYTVITLIYSTVLYCVDYVTLENTKDIYKFAGAALAFAIGWYAEDRWIHYEPRNCALKGQIIKLLIGVAGVLAIKIGLKPVLGDGLAGGLVRYFLMGAWMIAGYPLLINSYLRKHAVKA